MSSNRVIDCDVHQRFRYGGRELLPFLPRAWRDRGEQYGVGGSGGATSSINGGDRGYRADSWPEDGSAAGSVLSVMKEQLLDAYDIEYAVLLGQEMRQIPSIPDADWASVLATAYNDWLAEEWLSADSRLKGAILVAPQVPADAAKEIRRMGKHPDMVQVLVSNGNVTGVPYGKRFYDPIFEACVELGLPFALHTGGEGTGPAGKGSYYIENRQARIMGYMANLASMVFEGVFERFPDLKVVFIEGGYIWLPSYLWRLDADWKSLRDHTPWVKKPPSEYVHEHCFFTTQPIEATDDPQQIATVLEWGGARSTLMFCTDYPHWDFDSPLTSLPPMDEELKRRILSENARELYGLN